jgi:hypothetical protein
MQHIQSAAGCARDSAGENMKKPLILGGLGMLIGYFIYLMIDLFSRGPLDKGLGGLIALVVGVIFFFIGKWYYSRNPNK